MEIRGPRDVEEIIVDLLERGTNLLEPTRIGKEYLEYIDDHRFINDVFNRFSALYYLTPEFNYYKAIYEVEDNMNLDIDNYEKIIFVMKKHFCLYIKECMIPYITKMIDEVRREEVDDYRVRDWQMDVARKMEMIRDYYKERYGVD